MIFFKFFILGGVFALVFPPFFMLPLGFLIFSYLTKLLCEKSYERTFFNFFLIGFSFGFGFLLIYLSWIYNPFLIYKTTKPFAILAIFLPAFLSIFFGFSFLLYKFFKNFLYIILITPFIFVITEFLISNSFYGFPWITNSLIISNNLFGFYLIKYSGTIPSGYLIISIFLIPTLLLNINKLLQFKKIILLAYTPLMIISILVCYYFFFTQDDYVKKIEIDAHQIFSPINKANKNNIDQNIINFINNSKADYIIFAENNLPFQINEENFSKLNKYTNDNVKVIIGATTYKNNHYYNSFLLLEKDNIQYFDKKILVPFGEFLPLRKYLSFMELISGSFDFKPGNIERILKTNDNLNILPIICYEIIFDNIFNNINDKEIDILINITNDAWFGSKVGPYQHFYLTRIKSLLANKPLVRVSNNGISAIFDHNGNIVKYSSLNKVSKLNYKLNINKTVSYINFHKFFFYYLFMVFFALLIFYRMSLSDK